MKNQIIIIVILTICIISIYYTYSENIHHIDNFRSPYDVNINENFSLTARDRLFKYIREKKQMEIMDPIYNSIQRYDLPNYVRRVLPQSQLKDFLLAAQLSLLAYNTNEAQIAEGCKQLGLEFVKFITYSSYSSGSSTYPKDDKSCWCFIAKMKDGTQVLAIEGDEYISPNHNLAEIWENLSIYPRYLPDRNGDYSRGMYVQEGIFKPLADLWLDISQHLNYGTIDNPGKIWVCGHSLGGARATLTSYFIPKHVRLRITTAGSPKCANKSFWEYFIPSGDRSFTIERLVTDEDFAPDWLPSLPYDQPAQSFFWLSNSNLEIVDSRDYLNISYDDHSLKNAYIPRIGAMII